MGGVRILVVQELWWPSGGGGLLATHLIAKALAKNGFEVRVVTGTRGYEAIARARAVDVDRAKVEFAKRLGAYDELYALDIRAFGYPEAFDAVIAVESVHGILDAELLRRLEGLAKQGGLIVLALPALSRSVTASVLVQQGFAVYRYFLRGFILVRVDKAEVLVMPSRLWRVLGLLIKIFHPMLKLCGMLEKSYLLAYKVV